MNMLQHPHTMLDGDDYIDVLIKSFIGKCFTMYETAAKSADSFVGLQGLLQIYIWRLPSRICVYSEPILLEQSQKLNLTVRSLQAA